MEFEGQWIGDEYELRYVAKDAGDFEMSIWCMPWMHAMDACYGCMLWRHAMEAWLRRRACEHRMRQTLRWARISSEV